MCCGFMYVKRRISLDRTGYRAADAGLWVTLELVIWWTRDQLNLIGYGHVLRASSFFMDLNSVGPPNTVML
jgi:hypothetical protein